MTTKNYVYGCRAPLNHGEVPVVAQMRLAHRYRNQLVEIELTRRAALDAAGGKEANQTDRERINGESYAAIRGARANCGLYWGTYLAVEQDCESFRSGAPPRFRPWIGEGKVAVQIQGGMPAETLHSCEDRRLRMAAGARPKFRVLSQRIGSDGRDPIWVHVPVIWHRELPPCASIKWAQLQRRVVGRKVRWQLTLTIDVPDSVLAPPPGICGIDINYRVTGAGSQRAATAYGSDDEVHKLYLTPRIVSAFEKCEHIQSVRSDNLNAAKIRITDESLIDTMPPRLQDDAATLSRWRSCQRLAQLVLAWRRLGGCPKWLTDWQLREHHLHDYESQLRDQAQAARRDLYRCWVAGLAKLYGTVCLEDMDLRQAIHACEDAPTEEVATAMRRRARWVNLSSLRQMLGERFTVRKVPSEWSTTDCHACGHRNEVSPRDTRITCSCGIEWDVDENAARNLLARGQAAPAAKNGKTRKKRVSRAERNAAARKKRSEAKRKKEL